MMRFLFAMILVILGCFAVASLGTEVQLGLNVCEERKLGDPMCAELFVAGVVNAGTVGIWEWLTKNNEKRLLSDVEGTIHWREPQFFGHATGKLIRQYAELFPARETDEDLAVDGSASYMRFWNVPEKIKESLPANRLRFIVCFRDPALRAYSWYRHANDVILKDGNEQDRAFKMFDYSFAKMASYAPNIIQMCIEGQKSVDTVYQECAGINPFYWNHNAKVPGTKNTTTAFHVIATIFADGLYGFLLTHWFKYFKQEQFCPVIYEHLLKNFNAEISYIEPCLQAFGRKLDLLTNDEMPMPPLSKCENCSHFEALTKQKMKSIGKQLHAELYQESNELFRTQIMLLYNRNEPIRWEDSYNDAT